MASFVPTFPYSTKCTPSFRVKSFFGFLRLTIQYISIMSSTTFLSLEQRDGCWRHLVNNLFRLVAQPPINGCESCAVVFFVLHLFRPPSRKSSESGGMISTESVPSFKNPWNSLDLPVTALLILSSWTFCMRVCGCSSVRNFRILRTPSPTRTIEATAFTLRLEPLCTLSPPPRLSSVY